MAPVADGPGPQLSRHRGLKIECVYGPDTTGWDDVDELELATLSWVHWFNEQRLHGYCHDVPPTEFEAAFYAAQQADPEGVGTQ